MIGGEDTSEVMFNMKSERKNVVRRGACSGAAVHYLCNCRLSRLHRNYMRRLEFPQGDSVPQGLE